MTNSLTPKILDTHKVPLALYVHIPWCERKCPYCDFNSHESFDPSIEIPYVKTLLTDLKQQLSNTLEIPSLTSIFIGGGTPSLFSGKAIGYLLAEIDQLINIGDAEVTLESNPGSAEAKRYANYRAAGVNRLSIGIQSFNEQSLKQLGRIHSADQARVATNLAARHFERFNLDLMHGLPGQTSEATMADLDEGILRSGGHLSWYQLTIEPNTIFWSYPPKLPTKDVLADIQDLGEIKLINAGFEHYEISAWCRPGQASRHNLNYWTFGNYIGIGAGAQGKLSDINGSIFRTHRPRHPKNYMASIATGKQPAQTPVAKHDLPGEFMLNALRLLQGVPAALFNERTGLSIKSLEPILSELRSRQLLVKDPKKLQTTDIGSRFLNDVIIHFLT